MTADIVQQLRDAYTKWEGVYAKVKWDWGWIEGADDNVQRAYYDADTDCGLYRAAADEIERLREALGEMAR